MERIKRHKIKILCGLLYTFCLFNLLGISMHTGQNENKPAKESKEEEAARIQAEAEEAARKLQE